MYGHLIFDKGAKTIKWKKDSIFFIKLFICTPYFTPALCPPTVPHPIPPPHPMSPLGCYHPHPIWPLNSLGPPVSSGIVASSLTEHRPWQCSTVCVLGGLISAGACCLFGGPVFERSRGSRLIETAGPPTGLPSSSASFSLSLIQQQGSTASVHWLGGTIYIWLFQLLVGSPECSHARSLFVSTL